MSTATMNERIEVADVKAAAKGRTVDILVDVAGIPRELLDGKHHPCPNCGGVNRFRLVDEAAGAVRCNQCFTEKCGDFIAASQWMTGQPFRESLHACAAYLGMSVNGNARNCEPVDLMAEFCKRKYITVESLQAYGAKLSTRGKQKTIAVPMFGEDGNECGHQDCGLSGALSKGLTNKGGKSGLFLPGGELPSPERTVYMCEGFKDAAALQAMGFYAVGTPGTTFRAAWARMFRGCRVVLIPDRDKASYKHFKRIRKLLAGVAASVGWVDLPFEMAEDSGQDVRDLLQQKDGEATLRKLIDESLVSVEEEHDHADDEPRFSDLGNAKRLVRLHGASIRYCYQWHKWLVWDGNRWAIDHTGAITRHAKGTVSKLWQEVIEASDETRKRIAEFSLQSESARGLTAMVKLAESEAGVPITPDKLDRDPWFLNCENGTLELRTGRLRSHCRADHLTKLCPVAYDPNAKAPLWEAFLQRIFAENQALTAYLQRVCGVWLTGDVSEQLVQVFYGTGANGKSVLLGTMLGILGPDYGMKAAADLLMAKRNDSHPTERADLFGKRLACCIETDEGQRFNESLLKDLSGGDRQRARRMREDFWEFEPTHKLVLAVNHKPIVRGTDHGIWRRLRLVPFTVTIPDEEQDKQLPTKLVDEYPGILAWAVRGCLDWQQNGLRCPEDVKLATEEYRSEQDLLGEFIRECCVTESCASARATDLYEAFQKYTGSKISQTRFGNALNERGFDKAKTCGAVWRLGIGLEYEGDQEGQ